MYLIRFFCLLALSTLVFPEYMLAQPPGAGTKLSGHIINEQKKPVPYATVALLGAGNKVAGGALTEEDGSFSIDVTGTGTFSIKISGIGIKANTVNNIEITGNERVQKLGDITVTSSSKVMKEVAITAERSMMEMQVDKKVFNVEKNITTAGGSASDVLQNVPSLSVDVDGNVAMRGKSNITVLIDGKPATLLGGDVASALQSLPAASVQSVEVITNPSAKYDAQGMGGIVNIVTKRDKKLGLNGSITAGAGTRDKYNGGINLNLKNEKWNVFLNSNFRLNRNYHRNTTDRLNYNDALSFNSLEDNNRRFNGWFNSIGAEYTFDEHNSMTLTQNLNKMQWGNNGTSDYNIYNAGNLSTLRSRTSDNLGEPISSSSSADYKHKFKKPKQEFTANATYAKTWVERTQEYITNLYDGGGNLLNNPVYQDAPGKGSNSSLNAQADFTTPFLAPNGKLDAGLKSQLLWFESSNDPTIDSGSGPQVDYVLLNKYNYTQNTHAAYINFSNQVGLWSYQGGLRTEYADYKGTVSTLGGAVFTNDYLSLFPSVFVSYKMAKDQTIYISSTRRTDRPSFWRLMPYVDLSNPQDTSVGNPNLLPEFIYNTELNYQKQFKKGHNIILSAYYQYTQNLIERYRIFYADGTTFTQPQNLNSGTTYGLELTAKTQILPIWDATFNFNFFQNRIEGTNVDPVLDNSGSSWFGKVNTTLKLPQGFSLQVNGNYEAPKVAAQGELQEVYWLDVAVRKNLWAGKANLVFNVSDILNTRKYTTIYDQPQYTQTTYRDRETRIGNITFTYRFGKSDIKTGGGVNRRRGNQNNTQQQGKERDANLKTDESSEQSTM
jgi:iron complex outermembrane recepter protein